MAKICFNSNIFITIAVIAVLFIYFTQKSSNLQPIIIQTQPTKPEPTLVPEKVIEEGVKVGPPVLDKVLSPIEIRDKDDLQDPLRFPYKRFSNFQYPSNPEIFNIHTQGYPDTPHLQGYLYDQTDKGRVLPFFGSQLIPHRNRYRYYTMLDNVGLNLKMAPKLEIEYRLENGKPRKLQEKEIYDGDIVKINELMPGKFVVKFQDKNYLSYKPYL